MSFKHMSKYAFGCEIWMRGYICHIVNVIGGFIVLNI